MKTLETLKDLLFQYLKDGLLQSASAGKSTSYNKTFNGVSYTLTKILELELNKNSSWFLSGYWLDDILLRKVMSDSNIVQIWGVVIWGIGGTTNQLTSPIYCEVKLDLKEKNISELLILYGDKIYDDISYHEYSTRRDYWDLEYYSNQSWNPDEREWLYEIKITD